MTSRRSTWRDTYKVHPAADVFPMMSDDELAKLGEQDGEKIRGRPIDKVKAAAIATAKALPDPISARTVERSFAKAEGKQTAKPEDQAGPRPRRSRSLKRMSASTPLVNSTSIGAPIPMSISTPRRRSSSTRCARLPGSGPCRRKLTMTSATSLRVSTGADRAVRHDGRPLAYQGARWSLVWPLWHGLLSRP